MSFCRLMQLQHAYTHRDSYAADSQCVDRYREQV